MNNDMKRQENGDGILEVKKSQKADLEGKKSTWLLIGYVIVLATTFVAFEWTQTERKQSGMIINSGILLEEEVMIPITLPEKKVVPPPPEAKQITEILEIVDNDSEIPDETIQSIEDQGQVVEINDIANVVVDEAPIEDKIYQIVEDGPEFPGGNQALFKYLRDNINYPRISRENQSQGTTLVGFVVNTDGSITDVEILKSASDVYLDREAIRVIEKMPKWKPGRQAGKTVRVKFQIPVRFRLN